MRYTLMDMDTCVYVSTLLFLPQIRNGELFPIPYTETQL